MCLRHPCFITRFSFYCCTATTSCSQSHLGLLHRLLHVCLSFDSSYILPSLFHQPGKL
ncbi:hypothetical protein CPB83DRAFT_845447 [Crepidotus variabilis]|uniref:Uncharacterized protein n=1 Tax=Crepidotus variabilis TaxID=179855 RepID=A0A9P6JV31_9AGAR|nr:hypothetical protein CPB83DRAFT_845447 [Crepidotus variabilis]